MITSTYTVAAMTCGHCVDAVATEMAKLKGVANVEIDLESGLVTVTSAESLPAGDVLAALDEAGYALAAGGPGTP